MASLVDQIQEPAKSWTDVHEEGDVLHGLVIDRSDHTAKETGNGFAVLVVADSDGIEWELLTGRADLVAFTERHPPGGRGAP